MESEFVNATHPVLIVEEGFSKMPYPFVVKYNHTSRDFAVRHIKYLGFSNDYPTKLNYTLFDKDTVMKVIECWYLDELNPTETIRFGLYRYDKETSEENFSIIEKSIDFDDDDEEITAFDFGLRVERHRSEMLEKLSTVLDIQTRMKI